jgi:hypothetical protein
VRLQSLPAVTSQEQNDLSLLLILMARAAGRVPTPVTQNYPDPDLRGKPKKQRFFAIGFARRAFSITGPVRESDPDMATRKLEQIVGVPCLQPTVIGSRNLGGFRTKPPFASVSSPDETPVPNLRRSTSWRSHQSFRLAVFLRSPTPGKFPPHRRGRATPPDTPSMRRPRFRGSRVPPGRPLGRTRRNP